MRYALYKMPVEPTDTNSPVGMNDLLGLGEYASTRNALYYMRPENGDIGRCVNDAYETKWLGLYAFPSIGEWKLVLKEKL